jgi:hypothetical protein
MLCFRIEWLSRAPSQSKAVLFTSETEARAEIRRIYPRAVYGPWQGETGTCCDVWAIPEFLDERLTPDARILRQVRIARVGPQFAPARARRTG